MNTRSAFPIPTTLFLSRHRLNRCARWFLPVTFFVLFSSSAFVAVAQQERQVAPAESMEAGAKSFAAGNFEKAIEHWTQAVRAYQAAGNVEGQALAVVQSVQAYAALGRYPAALEGLQSALALADKTGNQSLIAAVTSALGNTYALAGRADEAEQLLRSSIEIATRAENAQVAASARNNLGNLLAAQDRFKEAAVFYGGAITTAREAGNQSLTMLASTNLARTLVESKNYDEAAALLTDVQQEVNVLPVNHDKAYVLISLGRLYARLAAIFDPQRSEWGRRAYAAFNDALSIGDAIGDERARSYALGYLGQLYEEAQRYDDALQLTQRAIFAARQADAPEALYRWYWQAGRALKTQGETEQAILAYQHAVQTLQGFRQDLTADYGSARASFRQSVGPVYFELADLLLQRSAAESDALKVRQYLVDARDTVELLKQAELEDYFQDDCVARLRAKITGIDQLAERTAAVYPVILEDRLELLVSFSDGMQRFTVPVAAATLTKDVRTFRRQLETRTTHRYYVQARTLYDWLIKPIERELETRKIDTLVFVPDGALRTIPFSALHDGKQFLISMYAVAVTPGLQLTDPRPLPRENIELLANGLTESVQGFPPLPYVGEELSQIKQLYANSTVLQDREFVVPKMEQQLSRTPYSIVHIASHAQFDSDVTKTFLLTYESKLSMDALEDFIGLTRFRDNAVELLTLSACQTAAGDDRAALGLAGVAVKAGARSALATLWPVNDPASAKLVSGFYRELQIPANSKAKALQQAQLEVLEDVRYRHPAYWSPFLLIGNWL